MSDVLSGVPITGVQLMPTSGLQKDGSGVSVRYRPDITGPRGGSSERQTHL